MGDQMTVDTFQPLVGRTFRVRDGRHAFALASVDVGDEQPGWERRPFTLIFRGLPDDILPEGMYALDAEGGESFELYLMPVHTPAPDRQDYQAVFA